MPAGIFNSTRIAVEHNGLVALAQRAGQGEQAGMYELFGGKIEDGETPFVAAIRETREETGKDLDFLTLEPLEFQPYLIDRGKNSGKKCRVFGFVALADDTNIQLSPNEHEPGSAIWVPATEVEHMPNITKASIVAIKGLRHLL